MGDDGAAGRELGVASLRGDRAHPQLHRLAGAVGHLAGQRPLPDQLVEPRLGPGHLVGHRPGVGERVARGPDGLVGLLGVLDLAGVPPRLGREHARPVPLGHLGPGGGHRARRQRRAVGAHVGDVALLVQRLGRPHGRRRGHAQLAGRLLLQGRGDERGRGTAPVRLRRAGPDRELGAVEFGGERGGRGLVEHSHAAAGRPAVGAEVSGGGHPRAVEPDQGGLELEPAAGCGPVLRPRRRGRTCR